ncbi:hypothetical protein [Sphingomonas mesophila]|nr:hypothetical protein [Sphingomonas mesophila]
MTAPIDPLDPVGYLVERIVPWQVQLGCLVVVVIAGVTLYLLFG